MALRFNPPPGWPAPPSGWLPPPGWRPDPSWPPAPSGWQFVVDDLQPDRPTTPAWVSSRRSPTANRQRKVRRAWILGGVALLLVIAAIANAAEEDGETPASDDTDSGQAPENLALDDSAPSEAGSAEPPPEPTYRVLDVVAGDRIRLKYHGETIVKVIGIDTPHRVELGRRRCSNSDATTHARRLLVDKQVALSRSHTGGARSLNARIDLPHGRDYGLVMIRRGYAVEDPQDDLGDVPQSYGRAERSARSAERGLWANCQAPEPPPSTNEPEPSDDEDISDGSCDPNYAGACVPVYPPDVDCADIGVTVTVVGADPHGLDADGDGYGCE